jgi:molybdopterin-containing oxidoreductase family iron-sulfur binding subunit
VKSLCQPAIKPLFDSRQEADSLLAWFGMYKEHNEHNAIKRGYLDWVKERWARGQSLDELSAKLRWEEVLRRGVIIEPPAAGEAPRLNREAAEKMAALKYDAQGFEIILAPHTGVYDGRYAENGWLLEAPDPVTKLMWDNAALISPQTASELGVEQGDLLNITLGAQSLTTPVLPLPGMADKVVSIALGLGRKHSGAEKPIGVNAWRLSSGGSRLLSGARITKAEGKYPLVLSQPTFSMHGRAIILRATLDQYKKNPLVIEKQREKPKAAKLYDGFDYSKHHKWAMTVDLNRCVGCNACVIACQAENNTPVVGKDQCNLGREMHWLRIDQYRAGDDNNPVFLHQPMLCQQCDYAPCENVCPVNATSHSDEGLNDMVYNRCVGTRYCANNCPYKVRRFNFFNFQKRAMQGEEHKLLFNPNVTVRSVGVMEKCTFCIQRINAAKFAALNEKRPLDDREIIPACMQACPAKAFTFGDMNFEKQGRTSDIAQARKSRRSFRVLEELHVEPNVTYLARLLNTAVPPGDAGERNDDDGDGR